MTTAVPLASVVSALFGDLDLGDERRDRWFRVVAQAMADSPGASRPQIVPDPSAYHACRRLFDGPRCTHANILGAHQEAVLNAMEARAEPLLLPHNTTLLDFSGHATRRDDLGPLGNGGGRGWLARHTLAVDPADRTALGLVRQILPVRVSPPSGETVAQKRVWQGRESRLWLRGLDEIGPPPAGCHGIDVADRGADIFEFLQALTDRARRFVVRSKHRRALGTGSAEEKAAALLPDRALALPAARRGTWTSRPGRGSRSERPGCRPRRSG